MKNSLKNLKRLKIKLLIIVKNNVDEEVINIGENYKIYIKKYDTILKQRISISFNMGFKNKNPFTNYNFVSFNLIHRNNDLKEAEDNASVFSIAFDEKNRLINKEFLLKQQNIKDIENEILKGLELIRFKDNVDYTICYFVDRILVRSNEENINTSSFLTLSNVFKNINIEFIEFSFIRTRKNISLQLISVNLNEKHIKNQNSLIYKLLEK